MRLLLAMTLCVLCGVSAAAEKIYRWTDRNGVTHYTDRPPAEGDYQQQTIAHDDARPRDTGAPAATGAAADPTALQREENCRRARANLDTLRGAGEVSLDRDGDGVAEPLPAEERTHQMELAAQQIRQFCEG